MTKLTQKKVKFEWGDKQEAAFQLLKQKLCSAPILALPEGSKDFIVYCDASNKGLGAVLMQREKWHQNQKTMQEAIEIATELMDKKIRTFAEHETASKRKFENTSRTTRNQQQQHSNKRSVAITNNANNQRGTGSCQKLGYYECGVQGHFKRECPKLKNNNNNQGNQSGRNNTPARVYAVGHAGTDPYANVVMGTFLLNNRYASILFDTGADRSFVSTTFSTQINITPSTLDHCYDVELADGRIIGLNTI
nr:reverse transcriptase domain-containing protein [Tanacetum cinerariifolium]